VKPKEKEKEKETRSSVSREWYVHVKDIQLKALKWVFGKV
jgi:hypothetical protein